FLVEAFDELLLGQLSTDQHVLIDEPVDRAIRISEAANRRGRNVRMRLDVDPAERIPITAIHQALRELASHIDCANRRRQPEMALLIELPEGDRAIPLPLNAVILVGIGRRWIHLTHQLADTLSSRLVDLLVLLRRETEVDDTERLELLFFRSLRVFLFDRFLDVEEPLATRVTFARLVRCHHAETSIVDRAVKAVDDAAHPHFLDFVVEEPVDLALLQTIRIILGQVAKIRAVDEIEAVFGRLLRLVPLLRDASRHQLVELIAFAIGLRDRPPNRREVLLRDDGDIDQRRDLAIVRIERLAGSTITGEQRSRNIARETLGEVRQKFSEPKREGNLRLFEIDLVNPFRFTLTVRIEKP